MSQSATGQFSDIFISYRRDDSSGHAGRLFDRLSAHFSDEQIFMDIDQIEPGEDFVQVIESAVGSCEILIALIGRNWLTSRDEVGRRLDNPNDFVRLEIKAALVRGIPVIPVLVQGAHMPRPHDLPEDLLALSRRHALELSDLRWKHDIDQLTSVLEKILARQREAKQRAAQQEEERKRVEAQRKQAEEQFKLQVQDQLKLQADDLKPQSETDERRQYREAETEPTTFNKPLSAAPESGITLDLKPTGSDAFPSPIPPLRVLIVVTVIALSLVCALGIWWVSRQGEQTLSVAGQIIDGHQTVADDSPSTQTANRPSAPPGMVYVPGGEFLMGNNAGDEYESPEHKVAVKPFFIDRLEVTNAEYAKFIKETDHKPPSTWKDGSWNPSSQAYEPVTGVTWDDAQAYAQWARKRLPTEEEWEFAARGTSGRYYPWGNEWVDGLANANGASSAVAYAGKFGGESPFGVRDMVGNVWEWTATKLAPYPPKKNLPITVDSDLMVIRGGSFAEDRGQATATYRGYLRAKSPNNQRTGFRCVRSIAN